MVYTNGQTYNVPPSVAYRWQSQGLAALGTVPTIAAAASAIKARSALISLAGPSQISQPSDWWVEYGRTTSYGQRSPVAPRTVAASAVDGVQLNALVPGVLYHWRVVAVGAGGRVNQADQTLTTLAPSYNP
jgi:hypothetical protein